MCRNPTKHLIELCLIYTCNGTNASKADWASDLETLRIMPYIEDDPSSAPSSVTTICKNVYDVCVCVCVCPSPSVSMCMLSTGLNQASFASSERKTMIVSLKSLFILELHESGMCLSRRVKVSHLHRPR